MDIVEASLDEQPKKVAKLKMVGVRPIEKVGASILVEYYDPKKGAIRVTIPREMVVSEEAPLAELEAGIPHGVQWDKVKVKAIDPHDLSRAFRDEGIFTLEDLGKKRQAAYLCITRLSGLVMSDILEQLSGGSK